MFYIQKLFEGRNTRITSDVSVHRVHEELQKPIGYGLTVSALWDTGASVSVISKETAENLKLKPLNQVSVFTGSGILQTTTYSVFLGIKSNSGAILFQKIKVNEFPGHPYFDFLIGMDVITRGKFSIDCRTGDTLFTFQIEDNNINPT